MRARQPPEQRGSRPAAAAGDGRRRPSSPARGVARRLRGCRCRRRRDREHLRRGRAAHRLLTGEIAVVENATRAWDMAFYGLQLGPGDTILTSRAEYASNVIAFLQRAARTGARVEVVDDDEHGQLDTADLARRMDERTKLIAVTHVPTQGGLVNPAAEIGAIAQEHGVPFLLDACQSVGQLPLDVAELRCDFLSATGRKYLRGPRGTGFLYVASEWIQRLEPPFLDLHAATSTSPGTYRVRDDARRFENWETNYAGKIGLGVAIDYALGIGLERVEATVSARAELLRERLADVDGVAVHDQGLRRCGIVTFSVDGHDASAVKQWLTEAGINTSVTASASSRNDLEARGLGDLVRASVHYYNTEDEVLALVERVVELGS
ncbi:aminotransferase class V-fold PLP-dependent enzyme [Nocardioides zeae]